MTTESNQTQIKTYRVRWLILILIALCNAINFMQNNEFTIIADVIKKFYNVSGFAVNSTSLIFFELYIVFFLPVSYLIEKFNLKVTALCSMTLTLVGNLVKIFSNASDKFYLALMGQASCALGQIYLLSILTKLASVWFPPNEISTACSIALLGEVIGTAIGSIIPPFVVHSGDSQEDMDMKIKELFIYYMIISCVIWCLVIFFFKEAPPNPPSPSQAERLENPEDKPNFLQCCKSLIKNKDFIYVLVIFGLINGTWNGLLILINKIYLNYFPDGGTDVGVINLLTNLVGGSLGTLVIGMILDKTHKFKQTSFCVMVLSCIMFGVVIYTLYGKLRIATFFSLPILGFFVVAALVLNFEYAAEVTYPVPESVSCSLANVAINLFSIIENNVFEFLIDYIGFPYTSLIALIILLGCTFGVFLASPKLRRRDANVVDKANVNLTVYE